MSKVYSKNLNHQDIELDYATNNHRHPSISNNKRNYSVAGYRKVQEDKNKAQMIVLNERICGDLSIGQISKIKIYKKSNKADHFTLKVQADLKQSTWLMPINDCQKFAVLAFVIKLSALNINVDTTQDFTSTCEGEVLKKGEILKKWEPRHLLITIKDGLMSYKDKSSEPTLKIGKTQQLWTRFELIENQKYIVFKIWYSIVKEEFAVPIKSSAKWFKAFASLLDK